MIDPEKLSELGLAPLSARSIALSALLGTHPARLPVRALVASGALFGVAEGTMRTALSRMVGTGELRVDDGHYSLSDRLLRRQAVQDVGRRPVSDEPWDGSWLVAVVDVDRRSIGERRAFRARMAELRMGELRSDLWLRPANLVWPGEDSCLVARGSIEGRDPKVLARRLWDLDNLAAHACRLKELVDASLHALTVDGRAALADTFLVSVATVRFLRLEPRLPAVLVGPQWPVDGLRMAYDRLEALYASVMTAFLADVAPNEYYNA